MNSTTLNRLLACTALIGVSALSSQAFAQTVVVNGADVNIAADPAATPAISFLTDHVASVDDAVNINTGVITSVTNQGTLTLEGTSTVNGDVGDATKSLKLINAGIDAKTVTFGGNVFATSLQATGDGDIKFNGNFTGLINFGTGFDAVVTLADNKNITGSITNATTNEGTLTLSGTSTVTGAVGSTDAGLKTVNAGVTGETATITGLVTTTLLTVTSEGTVVLNAGLAGKANFAAAGATGALTITDGGVTGAVDSGNASTGTLNVNGTGTIGGAVGATKALAAVNAGAAGKTATFAAPVNTDLLTVTGTGTVVLNDTLTGAAKFGANGVLSVADGKTITGTIDSAAASTGTLTVLGTSTFAGAIGGTNSLLAINAGAAGKTATFGAPVKATTLNVTGAAGIVELNDTLTGNANFSADGVLTVADGKIVSGNVTATTTNTGTVNLAGSHAMTGSLGAPAGNKLKVINLTGAAGVVSVAGDIGATTINLAAGGTTLTTAASKTASFTTLLGGAGDDILNLNGTTTTTGATIDLAGGANVVNNAATGVFTGNLIATAGSIALTNTAGGQMTFIGASNLGAAGVLANKGTITLNSGIVLNAGTAMTAANNTGTFNVNLSDANGTLASTDIGQLASGGAIDLSAATVNVVYNPLDGTVGVGSVLFADGVGAATLPAALKVTDNTLAYTTTLVAGADTSDINLVVALAGGGFASLTASPNTDAVATAFQTLATAPFPAQTASVTALVNAFIFAPTAAAADLIAQQVIPTVDGGAMQSAMSFSSDTMGVVASELAALRLEGDAVSGISAGNNGQGARFWLQAMAGTGEQDPRDGINGYEADSYGFAAGIDTRSFGPNSVVGVAFSFSNADIDSANINRTNTEIDSYQGTLYGSAGFGNMNYLSGMLGYVWSDNDTSRTIAVIPSVSTGNYDSDQFVANLELGHDVKSGIMTFTPNVFANYANYSADDYVESGPLGLSVASEDMDLFEMGLGADVAWDIKQSGDGVLQPSLSASYRYDFIADEMNSTASFVGAPGVSFKTIGAEPEENKFNLGAGLKYSDNQWELSARYGFDYMEDYDAHSGMVRAGFNF